MLSSQTASQLVKFKEQGHCKHCVTWPDCFATPRNHCDVTAGLVSLNYVDALGTKMSQNMQWFKGDYNKTLLWDIANIYLKKKIFFHWINLVAWYQPIQSLIYLTLCYAFMCIFSITFKHWVRHNNRSFFLIKLGVTQWKEYHFEWFSRLECE